MFRHRVLSSPAVGNACVWDVFFFLEGEEEKGEIISLSFAWGGTMGCSKRVRGLVNDSVWALFLEVWGGEGGSPANGWHGGGVENSPFCTGGEIAR